MLQPHILTEKGTDYYGYGIEIMKSDALGEYYTHRGGIPGFHSVLTFIPIVQISIVILENIVEARENFVIGRPHNNKQKLHNRKKDRQLNKTKISLP